MMKFTLNNGLKFPAIGFGTYKSNLESIMKAIEAGYRYFDSAFFYGTEKFIAEAISRSGIKRENFFIASKIWKTDMGYENTIKAFYRTLENINSSYIDVYMIHWPRPDLKIKDWKKLDVETWHAMEELFSRGAIKALGISNFLPYHAQNIIANCKIMPSVAQLEFHPGYTQAFALKYFREKKILLQAWSPISRGRIFEDELIRELSEKYKVSPAQICINFCLHEGVMPLPKSSSSERMREILECMNFKIDSEDISRLENMPPLGWSGEHPDRERVKI